MKIRVIIGMILTLPLLLAGVPAAAQPVVGVGGVPAPPKVTLLLGCAEATGIPGNEKHMKTGGGNFVVNQLAPDTVEITMTGLAFARDNFFHPATAQFHFDLTQSFRVVFTSPDVHLATLQVQGYVMGLLRCPRKGSAEITQAGASVSSEDGCLTVAPPPSISLPPCGVGPGQNDSVYRRSDLLCVPVLPGCFTLRQTFAIAASQPCCGFHGAAADFSTSRNEMDHNPHQNPFAGISRKDFGFHVIVKVVPVMGAVPALNPATGAARK